MSLKKNIVIIGPAHPLRGGLASFNERLAREFQNSGHNVSVFSFSLQYPGFLFPGTTQYSSEPAPADIKIYSLINSVNPINWIRVGSKLKKVRPDLIVVRYWLPFMGPCLGSILRIVRNNNHTKIICIADNIIPHENRIADRAFTKYFLKPIDAFITMSNKVLLDLKKFAAAKPAVQLAHPLYDNFGDKQPKAVAKAKLGISIDENIILFFGFIRAYKGLDLLLSAFNLFINNQTSSPARNTKLLIAGEFYEDRKKYDELITTYNLADKVILRTQFIADSEVKYYLSAADVVVQPYRSATQSGVTPLAYHFEVPMIVTRVGGLPLMVPESVGLVAEPDAASIAHALQEFFQRGGDHFIPGLKEEKKKYSWSDMVKSILELDGSIATQRT